MKRIVVLLALFCVVAFAQKKGSFTDPRDKQEYRTVKIGKQIWMAENLNYNLPGGNSSCCDKKEENCTKYGRLYDWNTAVLSCPKGWHLPNSVDFMRLVLFTGGLDMPTNSEYEQLSPYEQKRFEAQMNMAYQNAGLKLRAKNGWTDLPNGKFGGGTDDFGFSVIPAGRGFLGEFLCPDYIGTSAIKNEGRVYSWLWTSDKKGEIAASARFGAAVSVVAFLDYKEESTFSVRCLKD